MEPNSTLPKNIDVIIVQLNMNKSNIDSIIGLLRSDNQNVEEIKPQFDQAK